MRRCLIGFWSKKRLFRLKKRIKNSKDRDRCQKDCQRKRSIDWKIGIDINFWKIIIYSELWRSLTIFTKHILVLLCFTLAFSMDLFLVIFIIGFKWLLMIGFLLYLWTFTLTNHFLMFFVYFLLIVLIFLFNQLLFFLILNHSRKNFFFNYFSENRYGPQLCLKDQLKTFILIE